MKQWYLIILVILVSVSSCGILKDKNTERKKESFKFSDKTTIQEKAPGANTTVFLPYPLPNPKRPKNETKKYTGENNSSISVDFDSLGVVRGINSNCPEVNKLEQRNVELEAKIKSREVETKANIELADTIGKWIAITLIPIGFFFALAWWLRGKNQKGR